jgi:hypothetical protein
MKLSREQAFLARLARPLQPARQPYYVRAPMRPGELVGWYWQPKGAAAPEPLGSNVYFAQASLEAKLRDAGELSAA